jgi:hypothetical protein
MSRVGLAVALAATMATGCISSRHAMMDRTLGRVPCRQPVVRVRYQAAPDEVRNGDGPHQRRSFGFSIDRWWHDQNGELMWIARCDDSGVDYLCVDGARHAVCISN